MSRVAIVVALVAAFLIGASLGLMGGIAFMARHRPPVPSWLGARPWGDDPGMRPPGIPGGRPAAERSEARRLRVLAHLRDDLGLTEEQVARIQPLIDEAHRTMGATRDSLRARIDRVLTPEQRERLRRLEARRGFPGDPRGPGGRAHRAQPGDEGEER